MTGLDAFFPGGGHRLLNSAMRTLNRLKPIKPPVLHRFLALTPYYQPVYRVKRLTNLVKRLIQLSTMLIGQALTKGD